MNLKSKDKHSFSFKLNNPVTSWDKKRWILWWRKEKQQRRRQL